MAGICGSDLHVYHGRETGLDHGTVMGHEFTGVVEEDRQYVRKFKKGSKGDQSLYYFLWRMFLLQYWSDLPV